MLRKNSWKKCTNFPPYNELCLSYFLLFCKDWCVSLKKHNYSGTQNSIHNLKVESMFIMGNRGNPVLKKGFFSPGTITAD